MAWILWVWLLGSSVTAQDYEYVLDLDLIHGFAQNIFETWAPESIREEWEIPPVEEWHAFWAQLDRALYSDELIDLAWLKPEAEAALGFLQRIPGGGPYADWLRQRIDYLNMSHNVLSAYQNTREPLRPETPSPKPSLRPPVSKPPIEVSARENRDMKRVARNPVNWERTLAGRAAPARAETLVPSLKQIFEEEGIPGELVWLAEVESSFNPSARSPVGATGLFQFMPATAERFGMQLAPTDERLDPQKSARAAAQYLRFLYGRFESWPLALAAYNAGEGRVGRLLRQHNGDTFEDIVAYLPSETQMYVPKVMATLALREGIDPTSLRSPERRG